jgi:hypothetical protein
MLMISSAADATNHLFFAYLRSQSPDSVKGINGISTLPMSLQKLLQETEYPPETPTVLQTNTAKVVMIVSNVSPTPFALLRRANHFQYRDDDYALQQFAHYDDPVQALSDECRRVLRSISSANQSQISSSKQSTGLTDASWSRFEDIGFSGAFDEAEEDAEEPSAYAKSKPTQGLRTTPASRNVAGGRPTTPSWADFLSSGFVDETKNNPAPLLLPPDKILPPIDTSGRGRSSQSHRMRHESETELDPGELANIIRFDLDEAFWWVWISSLAGEETGDRKSAFGRCALVETIITGGKWLVFEEMVKGAAAEPAEGAYVAEKKSRFGWTRRSKGSGRRQSTGKHDLEKAGLQSPVYNGVHSVGVSKTSIGPDQHARIQAAAARLQSQQRQQENEQATQRRGRDADTTSQKTNSVMTLQPVIMSEASPAMKWANKYDKDAIREAYLSDNEAGKGLGQPPSYLNGSTSAINLPPPSLSQLRTTSERDLPRIPVDSPSDVRPEVPEKSVSPPAAPLTSNSMPIESPPIESPPILPSEKAAELAPHVETHPLEREAVATPEPIRTVMTPEPEAHPPPSSPGPVSKKQHKLQKKTVDTEPRGFKKLFGRRNRQSIQPETMSTLQNGGQHKQEPEGQLQPGGATIGRRFSGFRKKSPSIPPVECDTQSTPPVQEVAAENADENITPTQSPVPPPMSYEPSLREDSSRIDTAEAHEAHREFAAFDQGPLEDMPAFAPESEASHSPEQPEFESPQPSPVARKPVYAPVTLTPEVSAPQVWTPPARSQPPMAAPVPVHAPVPAKRPTLGEEERFVTASSIPQVTHTPPAMPTPPARNTPPTIPTPPAVAAPAKEQPVPVQDRWAQIRKNAAERAAQGKEQPVVTHKAESAKTEEEETSGEESKSHCPWRLSSDADIIFLAIESRVARIKARVAELTGNMDSNGAPAAPPARRW